MFFCLGLLCGAAGGWAARSGLDTRAKTSVEKVPADERTLSISGVKKERFITKEVSPNASGAGKRAISAPSAADIPLWAVRGRIAAQPAETPEQAEKQISDILKISSVEKKLDEFNILLTRITLQNASLYHAAWLRWERVNKAPPEILSAIFNRRIGGVMGSQLLGQRTGYNPKDMEGINNDVRLQFIGWIEADPAAAEMWLHGLEHSEFRGEMENIWNLAPPIK